MLDRFQLQVLLLGLTLLMLGRTYEASSLGLTVHVVPLDSDGGKTVQAHFSVIASSPCPSLSGLCAPGEDCLVHTSPIPFTGTKPSDWCVLQWQKTVPSNYSATINLGSNTELYVSMNAGPTIRANSGRLNQPAFVALPPPLRARVNCSQLFNLSVKDLDGDNVRCRFARSDKGECVTCTQHSFIELDEEKCILSFTGKAPTGQYFIYLMAEDWIPLRRINYVTDPPLSSVPVHLSLTVEESAFTCSDVPVAIERTPNQDSVLFVLPYQEEKINIDYRSEQERQTGVTQNRTSISTYWWARVLELAVVGPPGLFRTGLTSVGQLANMTISWIRSVNNLNQLLPICFIANTKSLQSEPRCVWLYQRKTRAPPAGTELRCGMTEMILVLPITSFTNYNLAQLQLNSPTCSVTYNSTHLIANISFNGCGTKSVYFGPDLIYTNTLKTVQPYTLIIRKPSLILPLACRVPRAQVTSKFSVNMPTEREAFGEFRVWIEVYPPGEGPLGSLTKKPRFRSNFRVRRDANSGTGNFSTNSISTSEKDGTRINQVDLYVRSNTSVAQAEMIVNNCIESETKDFAESTPIVKQGCITSSSTFEIITDQNNTRIYRLDLNSIVTKGTTVYIQCTVNLCITTVPSQSCPDLCSRSENQTIVVRNLFSSTYTVTSGPVSVLVTPTTTDTLAPATPASTTPTPATPSPDTPALATPTPATPSPDTPALATPTPATPALATPTPATPALATPTPATPALATPTPATSALAAPTPATPALAAPTPATPALATPTPATPALATPTPATPSLATPTPATPATPTPATPALSTITPANATNTTTTGNTTSVNATSMPATTNVTATTTNSVGQSTTSSAPEQASSLAAGVIFTALSIFLQKLLLY